MPLFESPLSTEECRRRLASRTERDLPFRLARLFTPAVLARIGDRKFRLRIRRGTWSNSFDPLFYGQFQPTAAGVRIRGRFRIHPLVLGLTGFWFVFVVLLGVPMLLGSLVILVVDLPSVDGDTVLGVIVPLGLLAFGVTLVRLCLRWGLSCRDQLRAFLCETLDAIEIEESTSQHPLKR